MNVVRGLFIAAAVVLSLALQVSFFPHFAVYGVVPNLVLLVVVAAALSRGARFAMVVGFLGGLSLDLVPPADHVAGRWALALVLVAWVASRVRQDVRPSPLAVLATVAASSFVGTSVFALTGLVLRDPVVGVGEMLAVIGVAVVSDLVLAPLVLPPTMKGLDRIGRPDAEAVRV